MIQGHGGNIHALADRLGCRPAEIIDMSSNINPLGMVPGMLAHLERHLDHAGRLPEVDCRAMIRRMAVLLDLNPRRVLAGNGTTQFIYTACPALDARQVLIIGPTYADYADACRMHGIEPHYWLLKPQDRFAADLDRLDRAVEGFDLVFICNPNNPTGGLIPVEQLRDVCQNQPRTRFIIDESYLPFAPAKQSRSMAAYGLENVIVLWSASKIFGMPGLRAGFLIARGKTVSRFRHYAQPWSVNSLAQAAIDFLGRHKEDVADFVARTAQFLVRERGLFRQRLQAVEALTIYPSKTSYLLIRLPRHISAQALCKTLSRERLLIRGCGNFYGLSPWFVRVSLKRAALNQIAADRIASAIEELKGD